MHAGAFEGEGLQFFGERYGPGAGGAGALLRGRIDRFRG